ncbi:MAG: tRNA pseudouridine(13) synthase TruD [Candidatus Thorarchaeota archaeon]|nr:tRNA pseudouridine(13) synthase TruD [Candidatus Thorarchaeota archaeon]
MREAHPLEQQFGIEYYSTDFDGIGGRIKQRYEDFIVEEITPEREVLHVQPWQRQSSEESLSPPSGKRLRFATFVVQKIGLSTMDVATILAAELRIPHKYVSYAGLKDKRAITVQAMSVPSQSIERLLDLRLARINIRDPQYTRRSVQIGDLWGNRFTIRLRDADVDCELAHDLMQKIGATPLLNYFGVQRFGVIRPYTHLVGKALLKDDFENAVRIILTTRSEYDPAPLTEARVRLAEELIPTDEIISQFPEDLRYERVVLRQLIKTPHDYKKAFAQIPVRVQTLFVHAYQSYLFNRLISRRAAKGEPITVPEVGDFLIQLDSPHTGRDSWIFVTERTIDEYRKEVSAGHYGLAAPVPGYSTKIPPSWQTDLLLDLLKEENISLMDFRNPRSRALDSAGGLHLISIRPLDLSLDCVENDLVASFSLRKGSYATVVMREIMKNHPINRI